MKPTETKHIIWRQHPQSNSVDALVVNGQHEVLSYFHVDPMGRVDYSKTLDKPMPVTIHWEHIVNQFREQWLESLRTQKMPSDASVTIPKRGELTPKRVVLFTGSLDYVLGFNWSRADYVVVVETVDNRAERAWERLDEFLPDSWHDRVEVLKLDAPAYGDFDYIPFKNALLVQHAYNIGLRKFPDAEAIEIVYLESEGQLTNDKNPQYFMMLEAFMNQTTGQTVHQKYSESSTINLPPVFISNPIWHKPLHYWYGKLSDGIENILEFARTVPWNCVNEVDSGELCGHCHKCWELFYTITYSEHIDIRSWFKEWKDMIRVGEEYLSNGLFDIEAQQWVLEKLRNGELSKFNEEEEE